MYLQMCIERESAANYLSVRNTSNMAAAELRVMMLGEASKDLAGRIAS
jgi:hypothetical protein